MKRGVVNFILDSALFLLFVGLISTGLIMEFILPPRSRVATDPGPFGGELRALWGLSRHEWGDIHFWLAVALVAGAALHVLLHWRWVVAMVLSTQRDLPCAVRRARAAVAIAGVVVALGLIVAPWVRAALDLQNLRSGQAVETPRHQRRGPGGP